MSPPADSIERTARISKCGRFRPRLTRRWAGGPTACFVMLNPSTADAEKDDPTIRRCIGFSEQWGCGGLDVVNLYSLRATDPKSLFRAAPRTRPRDERALYETACRADMVILAWGAHGVRDGRGLAVAKELVRRLDRVFALGLTKNGQPRHPLYVPRRALCRRLLVFSEGMQLGGQPASAATVSPSAAARSS